MSNQYEDITHDLGNKIDQILTLLNQQSKEIHKMSQALDAIVAAQANEDTLIGQAVALLNGMPAAIAAAVAAASAGDAAEAASILADMTNQSNTLAQALAAAAPATTTPAPAVTVPPAPSTTSTTSSTSS